MIKEYETTVGYLKLFIMKKKNEFLEDFREISLVGSLIINFWQLIWQFKNSKKKKTVRVSLKARITVWWVQYYFPLLRKSHGWDMKMPDWQAQGNASPRILKVPATHLSIKFLVSDVLCITIIPGAWENTENKKAESHASTRRYSPCKHALHPRLSKTADLHIPIWRNAWRHVGVRRIPALLPPLSSASLYSAKQRGNHRYHTQSSDNLTPGQSPVP